MRWIASAAALCALLLCSGCGLDPFGADTVPPIESVGARITEGPGTGPSYGDSATVGAGNIIQLEATIGYGNNVVVTVPRGPATKLVAEWQIEGSGQAPSTVTLESRNGEPISLGEAFEPDPGYIGIEYRSSAEQIKLRLAVPQLVDVEQGQALFTFKARVH
jgi:hypothetical protein